MVFSSIPQVITEDRASGAQIIERSLKFDRTDTASHSNPSLQATLSGAQGAGKFTISFWVKRGQIDTDWQYMLSGENGGGWGIGFVGSGSNEHSLTHWNGAHAYTPARFRDSSGWYHILLQSHPTNGTKYFVNGRGISYDSSTSRWNLNNKMYIGKYIDAGSAHNFDGFMSSFYCLDGLELGPSYFGYLDPLTNTWRPKKFKAEGITINDGTTWSNNTSGTFDPSYVKTNAFDGSLSTLTYAAQAGNDAKLLFNNKNIIISQENRLRVYGASGWSNLHSITSNGVSVTWENQSTEWHDLTDLFPTPWSFDSYNLTYNGNLRAIEVGGSVLTDGVTENIAFGNSGWYLPMDGKTPIGKDQSGNGNDWTPVGFGGSVDLPNATGAIPILNTNDAGTVAKLGVRTDKKTHTVTAVGGNYVIDEVQQPVLNAYRGGSYIFDYTGATSHPFYLSSLQDGKWNSKAYSVEFDGTGDSCSIGPSSDFTMGTGDFTIECFVQKDNNAHRGILQISDTAGGFTTTNYGTTLAIGYQVGVWQIYGTGNSTPQAESSSYSINTGQWYHLAYVRNNGVAKLYVDGVEVISRADTYNYNGTYIGYGGYYNSSYLHDGKISNLRVVKGQALYTSNFTRPSTTLTTTSQGAIASNVKLICCQDSDATTAAVKPGDITVNGDSVARNESPFLYNTNGQEGLNTATSNTTKITIPHWAADTLYYYCQNHSGMGSSINVTTDVLKADPYAWKCVLAIPGGSNIEREFSSEINVNSSEKSFSQTGTIVRSGVSNIYGASTSYQNNPDGGGSTGSTYATGPASSDFAWGTGDYTWEWWMYHEDWDNAGGNLDQVLIYQHENGSVSNMIETYIVGHNFQMYQGKGSVGNIAINGGNTYFTTTNNKWIHCAFVREGGYYKFFRDGVYVGKSALNTTSWANSIIVIGRNESNDLNGFDGKFQDIRMYGMAKYTGSIVGEQAFSVPSTEPDLLPDTPSGIISKINLEKIAEGAVSFNGEPVAGDAIHFPAHSDFQMGTGDFTIEAYFNCNRAVPLSCWRAILGLGGHTDAGGITIYAPRATTPRDTVVVILNTQNPTMGSTVNINDGGWHHVALVRNSGVTKLYVDGIEHDSYSDSNNYNYSGEIYIGHTPNCGDGDGWFKGFISNVRITKGQALYTSNFTPSTEPLTTSSQGATPSNVKLLCCQSKDSATSVTVQPSSYTTNSRIPSGFSWWDAGASSGWNVSGSNTSGGSSDFVYVALPTSGKIYWETVVTDPAVYAVIGVTDDGGQNPGNAGYQDNMSGYYFNGNPPIFLAKRSGASGTSSQVTHGASTGTTWKNGDILMWAVDCGSSRMWIGRNGTWYASGNPAGGTNYAFHNMNVHTGGTYFKLAYITNSSSTSRFEIKTSANSLTSHEYGSVTATNFNPFTNDINTIRGQETGYATLTHKHYANNLPALSNGGLTFRSDSSNTNENVYANFSVNDRKIYFEVKMDSIELSASSMRIGIARNTTGNNGDHIIFNGTGNFETLGTTNANFAAARAYGTGDVIGVAVDCTNDTGSVQFFKNGHKVGTQTFTVGSDVWHPYARIYRTAGQVDQTATFNFGQHPFQYSPPDDYQLLSLSNIKPEKVVARPDQYVKATIYTGDGSSSQLIKTGMKPDLVWVKCRSQAKWHALCDSVRGNGKILHTNSPDYGDLNENHIPSFTSNGFTVADIDSGTANEDTFTYVSWSWKAGGNNGQFNIDDVGYANASDVSMNIGGKNGALYNKEQIWSGLLTPASGTFDQAASLAFDGLIQTGSNRLRTSDNFVVVTMDLSSNPATVSSQIKVYGETGYDSTCTVTVSGTTYTSSTGSIHTFNVSGNLTQMTIRGNGTSGRTYMEGMEIDGKQLVDTNISINTPTLAATGSSVGTKQGFSIVSYTGAGGSTASISHGLEQSPNFVIIKNRDGGTSGSAGGWWSIYHDDLPNKHMYGFNATSTTDSAWNNHGQITGTNSSVVEVANGDHSSANNWWTHSNGADYIMYSWHDVPGLQKFGKFTAGSNGYVDLGFRPAIVIFRSHGAENWNIMDSTRDTINPMTNSIQPNLANAEYTSEPGLDFLSNGFKCRGSMNTSGTYIYAAWAEAPSINLYGAQSNAR